MNREDTLSPTTLFNPDHGVCGQPIMGMDDIKVIPHVIFRLKNVVDKRSAHVIDFFYEIGI